MNALYTERKVLITTSSFAAEWPEIMEPLFVRDLDVIRNPYGRKLSGGELSGLLSEYEPVALLAGTEPITRKVLQDSRRYLRVISRVGVGLDNVDTAAADELGIRVYCTKGVLAQSVAELTIGLILGALRHLQFHDRKLRGGKWDKRMGGLLGGKVLGIVGFGEIGQRVGSIARAFGADISYFDVKGDLQVPWAVFRPMNELLRHADIVSLHANGRELILGAEELKPLCNRGVIIVNTARGDLIDEKVLYHLLRDGCISCACLDVFREEPYQGELCTLDNVLLTPHIGSYAREARIAMEKSSIQNLIEGLNTSGLL